ncbi:hypothetical protein SORBI_3001G093600 [Sorghum bicolor]|uniref:Uncharacterized protein n=1 Tax=Sorghum bicolor TaxID=4558 RepID=A0A1B6QI57_SORBI|nr:hypothetical protein SORBI_3001G093600 [Sorghum bicolor]
MSVTTSLQRVKKIVLAPSYPLPPAPAIQPEPAGHHSHYAPLGSTGSPLGAAGLTPMTPPLRSAMHLLRKRRRRCCSALPAPTTVLPLPA